VRRVAYEFMPFAAIAPVLGAFASARCRLRAIGRWCA